MYRDGLPGLIAAAGAALGVTEARVAASAVQFGYAARLWSPVLGAGCDAAGHRAAPRDR
jgi:hypothetical protein